MRFGIFILVVLSLVSCKKDKRKNGAMTADVYSIKWEAKDPNAEHVGSALKISGCQGQTDGSVGTSQCIMLIIDNYSGPGTYQIDKISGSSYNSSVKGNNREDKIVSGTVIVTNDAENNFEGTFEFKGYNNPITDTTEITNGVFSIKDI